jgi:glutaredoxin
MEILIYTTSGCFYCDQAKKLCERANVDYRTQEVGVDIPREEFTKLYPHVTGYPYVIIDETEIGGLVETAKFFLKEGLVSVNK